MQVNDNPFSSWKTDDRFDEWMRDHGLTESRYAPSIVWVDLETTGLEPGFDVPIEAGIVITDKVGNVLRDGVATWLLFDFPRERWMDRWNNMPAFVRAMHEKSGLFEHLNYALISGNQFRMDPNIVQLDMVDWLNQMFANADVSVTPGDRTGLPMSGSSAHFDRAFIKADLPKLNDWFHYRVGVDASATREMARILNPHVVATQPTAQKGHRPLDDLADSIHLYQHLIKTFLNADAETEAML